MKKVEKLVLNNMYTWIKKYISVKEGSHLFIRRVSIESKEEMVHYVMVDNRVQVIEGIKKVLVNEDFVDDLEVLGYTCNDLDINLDIRVGTEKVSFYFTIIIE